MVITGDNLPSGGGIKIGNEGLMHIEWYSDYAGRRKGWEFEYYTDQAYETHIWNEEIPEFVQNSGISSFQSKRSTHLGT